MKRLMVAFAFVLIFTSISRAQSPAPIAEDKRQEIEKMLKLAGIEKQIPQMLAQVIARFKAQSPEISDEFWVKFQKKVDPHEFVEEMIPLYDEYYTLDDLKAINAFYETPAGQKLLSVRPQIMQGSMKIGQEWGAKLGAEVEEEMRQEQAAKTKAPQ
jgi:uncharacterized protein